LSLLLRQSACTSGWHCPDNYDGLGDDTPGHSLCRDSLWSVLSQRLLDPLDGCRSGSRLARRRADPAPGQQHLLDLLDAFGRHRRAARAGLDQTLFSGHSMSAGFAISAAMNGIEDWVIMRHMQK
jgi:hypothetical protein